MPPFIVDREDKISFFIVSLPRTVYIERSSFMSLVAH